LFTKKRNADIPVSFSNAIFTLSKAEAADEKRQEIVLNPKYKVCKEILGMCTCKKSGNAE
jgi:hypothetical protein